MVPPLYLIGGYFYTTDKSLRSDNLTVVRGRETDDRNISVATKCYDTLCSRFQKRHSCNFKSARRTHGCGCTSRSWSKSSFRPNLKNTYLSRATRSRNRRGSCFRMGCLSLPPMTKR